jgi:hypothetical protein
MIETESVFSPLAFFFPSSIFGERLEQRPHSFLSDRFSFVGAADVIGRECPPGAARAQARRRGVDSGSEVWSHCFCPLGNVSGDRRAKLAPGVLPILLLLLSFCGFTLAAVVGFRDEPCEVSGENYEIKFEKW